MAYETIIEERRGKRGTIVWITLNRPEKLNAINHEMYRELRDVFERIRGDREIRCLVITGAGRGFSAGEDHGDRSDPSQQEIKVEPRIPDPEHHRINFRRVSDTFLALRRVDVPVIAAVNGVCVGAAFDMVATMDLAVASTAARYQVAYVKRGVFADLGGFWTLPKIIGWRKAMELMMTGNFMSAEEGYEVGLTNYLVPPEELESKTMELAQAIEDGPPIAQKIGKMLAYRTTNMDFESAIEWSGTALGVILESQDRVEGIKSFLEKRDPVFEGR